MLHYKWVSNDLTKVSKDGVSIGEIKAVPDGKRRFFPKVGNPSPPFFTMTACKTYIITRF
jgi:hypothetical protein